LFDLNGTISSLIPERRVKALIAYSQRAWPHRVCGRSARE